MDVVIEKKRINPVIDRLEDEIKGILGKHNIKIDPYFFDRLYSRPRDLPLIELKLIAAIFKQLDEDNRGITIDVCRTVISDKTDRLVYYADLFYSTDNKDKVQIIDSMKKAGIGIESCRGKERSFDHLCYLKRIFNRPDLPLLAKVLKCFDKIVINKAMFDRIVQMRNGRLQCYYNEWLGDQTSNDERSIQTNYEVGEGSSSLSFFGSSTTTSAVSKGEDLSEKKSDYDKSKSQDGSQNPQSSTLHK